MNTNSSNEVSVTLFRETRMKLDAIYAQFAKTCGLSVTEYWALLLVSQGIETQSKLRVCLSIRKQTLNSALMALKQKGWVDLKPLESNLRAKRIILTNKGRQLVEECIRCTNILEIKAWQSLTKTEQIQLTELTQKFCALLAALTQA